MRDRSSDRRLLFLLSNDFGELSNALYFIKDCSFQTTMLLPERLFRINGNSLPVSNRCYNSADDVIDVLDQQRPDIVFLFSGYLYVANQLFQFDDFEELIRRLLACGSRPVTSDPFLGIMSNVDASTFSAQHPAKAWLTQHFVKMSAVLREVTHLYLIPTETVSRSNSISFYNPTIVEPPVLPQRLAMLREELAIDPQTKRWLFVLASEDYVYQVSRHGKYSFDSLLLRRLQDTVREGRQPVLLAPQPCITSMRNNGEASSGAVLLPFCGCEMFRLLLLDAEYVFYWNVFSNSIIGRVLNRLPLFFFDYGHMAHAIKPLFEKGIKCYYCDASLPFLDQQEQLRSVNLDSLGRQQEQTFASSRAQVQRSIRPEEMVERLIHAGPAEDQSSTLTAYNKKG